LFLVSDRLEESPAQVLAKRDLSRSGTGRWRLAPSNERARNTPPKKFRFNPTAGITKITKEAGSVKALSLGRGNTKY
jgi:hypothetical protein